MHYDVIQGVNWLHDPSFRDQRYTEVYKCNYVSYQFLVSELESWITSLAIWRVCDMLECMNKMMKNSHHLVLLHDMTTCSHHI